MLHYLVESLNVAATLYLAMAVYAITRPPNVINRLLFLIMCICATWAIAYYQELDGVALEYKLAWMRGRFLALPFLTVLWLMLTFHLVGLGRRITPTTWCLLFIVPALTVPIALTTHLHTWFRYGFTLMPGASMQPVLFLRGPWSIIYDTYCSAVQLIGIVMFVRAWRPSTSLVRKQIALLLVSSLLPIIATFLFNARAMPLNGLNPAPLVLFPAATALAIAVFRFQLVDVAPVARGMLFDHIHDGILVTDTFDHVVDMNTAAEKMVGVSTSDLAGRKSRSVPEPWAAALDTCGEAIQPVCCAHADVARWFERTRVPILIEGKPRGWMFVFQDITDRMALQQQQVSEVRSREEKKRAQQWSVLLRDLHDGVGSISANIGMLAELARKAPTAEAKDMLLMQIAELSAEGNIELRTMMNSLESRDMSWPDLFTEIRRFAALVLEPRNIRFALNIVGKPDAAPGMIVGTSVFRIVKESVTNVAKHAHASAVTVEFRFSDEGLELSIRDDGRWKACTDEGRGLRHLRQRVADLGGTFRLVTAPATQLTCVLPGVILAAQGDTLSKEVPHI